MYSHESGIFLHVQFMTNDKNVIEIVIVTVAIINTAVPLTGVSVSEAE